MSALVTEHLPLLASAPEGIKKLRGLILELAVRGKLVPQDPNDEPASELLKRIAQEKTRLLAEGGIKRQKVKAEVVDADAQFDLPAGWAWSRLSEVAIINPRNSAIDSLEISFVPMALIGTGFDGLHGHETRKWGEVKQGFTHFCEGDVGIAKITPCFENSKACVFSGLINNIGAGTTELHVVRPMAGLLEPRFVLAYLKSPQFMAVGETKMTGTAGQKRLPRDFVESNPFPLPPLVEQQRIVAKVDELMALCDRLEAQQDDAAAAHAQLVQTLLDSLTQAQDADDFAASWQRFSAHFDVLFTTEGSIDALKQTILQLAVMGKLVPQDPNDEPASKLLKRIAEEKIRLTAEGEIKRQKPLPAIDPQQKPFSVPRSWEWARIGDLAVSTDYGLSEKTANLVGGVPVLKMGDIQEGQVVLGGQMKVDKSVEGLPELYLKPGDLLYNRTNSPELVGKTGIFIGCPDEFTFASYLIRIRLPQSLVSPVYLNFSMNSPVFREFQINPHLRKQCGQANVNGTIMKNMLVSVPPFAEQLRIVAKVDELMSLCDQLKAQLSTARQIHEKLAGALVEQAVA